jgi:hypothetical protein
LPLLGVALRSSIPMTFRGSLGFIPIPAFCGSDGACVAPFLRMDQVAAPRASLCVSSLEAHGCQDVRPGSFVEAVMSVSGTMFTHEERPIDQQCQVPRLFCVFAGLP